MTIRQPLTLFGCALAVLCSFTCAKDRFPPEGEGGGSTTTTSTLDPETGDEQCSDGLDNDEDGLTDCCDTGCAGGVSCQAGGGVEEDDATCSDCIDQDNNTYTDCEDFSCSQNPDVTVCGSEDTDALCSDDEDNDGDSYVDCDDFDCSQNPDVTVCD